MSNKEKLSQQRVYQDCNNFQTCFEKPLKNFVSKTFNFKITSDDLDRTAIKVGKMIDCKSIYFFLAKM